MIGRLALLTALVASACALSRDLDESSGAHPLEWSTAGSPDFHGRWLIENDYPLGDCQRCHGRGFSGGDVDVSCETSGCHPVGIEACGTCHGQYDDALPRNLAHERHAGYCAECHPVPEAIEESGHIDLTVQVAFTGVAVENGLTPQWIATTRRCSGMSAACHEDNPTNPWEAGSTARATKARLALDEEPARF